MKAYHRDVTGCFIQDLLETLQRRIKETLWLGTIEASLQRLCGISWRCTTEMPWRRTTEVLLGVSFETSLRRRRDVSMVRHYYVLLRRCHGVPSLSRGDVLLICLGDILQRRRWVFHLRCTYERVRRIRKMSPRRCHNVFFPCGKAIVNLLSYGKKRS